MLYGVNQTVLCDGNPIDAIFTHPEENITYVFKGKVAFKWYIFIFIYCLQFVIDWVHITGMPFLLNSS